MARSTKEVFLNHLLLLCDWDIETDIKTNYAPDCVIITSSGVFCLILNGMICAQTIRYTLHNRASR